MGYEGLKYTNSELQFEFFPLSIEACGVNRSLNFCICADCLRSCWWRWNFSPLCRDSTLLYRTDNALQQQRIKSLRLFEVWPMGER